MITHIPARRWGLVDRGILQPGSFADINVFDPATVGPALPTVERDLPGGAIRLEQKATGFVATLVGGEVLLRAGEPTGALPGRLVRAPGG
jgi:N-acyl-D-aspartate/D-glutamate deacylase